MSLQTRISALATRIGAEVKTVKTTANTALQKAEAAITLPLGGTPGQMLVKTPTATGWADVPLSYNLGPLALASSTYENAAKEARKGTKPLKALVIGDSSNDGYGQPGGPTQLTELWPTKLAELMRADLGMPAGGRGFIGAASGAPTEYGYTNAELTPAGLQVDEITWQVGVPRAVWLQAGSTTNRNKARWNLAAGVTSVDIFVAGWGDTNALITTASNPTGTTVVSGDGGPLTVHRVTNPGAWVAITPVSNGFSVLGAMEYKGDELKGIQVRNLSLGGITTGDARNWSIGVDWSFTPMVAQFAPDVVLCNFGSNDLEQGWSEFDFRNAVRDLHTNLKAAAPNAQVVWILRDQDVPAWRGYSNNIADVVEPLGGHVLDLRDVFAGNTYTHIADGVHYTPAGNTKIAKLVKEYLRV